METKRYLVTGGMGFIGNSLVHRLVKLGHQVRVLDNASRGSLERLEDICDNYPNYSNNIEIINADIRDRKSVRRACEGIDCVCHLAFINGTEYFYTKPEMVLDVGIKGIINVIDGCIKESVRELMVASSSEVYQTPNVVPTDEKVAMSIPDPLNPRYSYAGGKIISELMAINFGRKYFERVVIFRPHNVYGPDMGWEHVIPQFALRMKERIKEQKEYMKETNVGHKIRFKIQGNGKQTRAFVFIDDFIDGLILVMNKGENLGIYNIGTMDEITIEKVVFEVGKYFGIRSDNITIVPGEPAEGGTPRRCPDITKIRNLGYDPRISFQDGLRITTKWYDENTDLKVKKRK